MPFFTAIYRIFVHLFNHNNETMSIQKARHGELDFIKCVMIILMVAFHLAYFSSKYPLLKQYVYTFHMPAFLVISGWLMPTHKPVDAFLRGLTRIIVPYIMMESAYIVASSVLGIEPLLSPLTPLCASRPLLVSSHLVFVRFN